MENSKVGEIIEEDPRKYHCRGDHNGGRKVQGKPVDRGRLKAKKVELQREENNLHCEYEISLVR